MSDENRLEATLDARSAEIVLNAHKLSECVIIGRKHSGAPYTYASWGTTDMASGRAAILAKSTVDALHLKLENIDLDPAENLGAFIKAACSDEGLTERMGEVVGNSKWTLQQWQKACHEFLTASENPKAKVSEKSPESGSGIETDMVVDIEEEWPPSLLERAKDFVRAVQLDKALMPLADLNESIQQEQHEREIAGSDASKTAFATDEYVHHQFETYFNELAKCINQTAVDKGWWDKERNDGEIIALMHSELSEALEALRQGNPKSTKTPQHSQLSEELADVIVRIMDYSHARGLRVAEALVDKIQYNKTRDHKHGGKEF